MPGDADHLLVVPWRLTLSVCSQTMSMTHLYLDMEPLANTEGVVHNDALEPGAPLTDGTTCVVGLGDGGKPLICKGVHTGVREDAIIRDFVEEFRAEDSIRMILAGVYNADEQRLETLTRH